MDRDADEPVAVDRRYRSNFEPRARTQRSGGCRQHVRDAIPAAAAGAARRCGRALVDQVSRRHSDVVGGFVALNDAEWADEIRFLQNAMGAVPSPFDCYLVLRGVKTLAVRM